MPYCRSRVRNGVERCADISLFGEIQTADLGILGRSVAMNTLSRRVAFATTAALLAVAGGPRNASAQASIFIKGASFGVSGIYWETRASAGWYGNVEYWNDVLDFSCCTKAGTCSMTASVNGKRQVSSASLYSSAPPNVGVVASDNAFTFIGAQTNTRVPVNISLTCQTSLFGQTYPYPLGSSFQMTFEVLIIGQ
jgi:hypothetical protein